MTYLNKFVLTIATIFTFLHLSNAKAFMVEGYVKDSKSGKRLAGVKIYSKQPKKVTETDTLGHFSLLVDEKAKQLFVSYSGYHKQEINLNNTSNEPLNIHLIATKNELKEISIKAKKENEKVQSTEIGQIHIPIKSIANIPVMGGERDIVKVLQLMPGIKRGNDGSTGMLVRGGNNDQNLILIDDAPVYNASHLLGFFSIFNSDALKEVNPP